MTQQDGTDDPIVAQPMTDGGPAPLPYESRVHPPPLVRVARFSEPFEANLALTLLHANDVEAILSGEHMAGLRYGATLGHVDLLVPEDQLTRATELLPQRATSPQRRPCPRCGSHDTRQIPRHPLIVLLTLPLLFLPLMFMPRLWKCGPCAHVWRPRGASAG